ELMSIEQIKNHLRNIQSSAFVASTYDTKGYLLRGSILTNGVTMQLAAFKLKELQSVRYKRLPEDKLPPRLTSTVGGTDHYLTEIRNVIGSKEDVTFYWPNCSPENIKILCLDLGQAYTAAASAILPDFASSNSPSKGKTPDKTATSTLITTAATSTTTTCNSSAITPMSASSTLPPQGTHVFHNLAVSQKAIMQPPFKHRHWIEEQKRLVPPGASKSVEQIESQLPALCGEGASVVDYLTELDKFQDQLDIFYNGNNDIYMKHEWDAKRARDQEFKVVANRLLGVVGGSIGCKRKDDNMVVIGIGLGDFSSKTRLTSLHGSFVSYFVGTARALGYIVVGLNEFYTSKKCPVCQDFVSQANLRRLYCRNCGVFMHRDIMAADNMCNIVRGHLLEQRRSRYLQPVDAKGHYPWEEECDCGLEDNTDSATKDVTKSNADEHKRKREELSKKPEGASTSEIEAEGDVEAVPPKKIKPEVDASETVSKAEVKQIQRNLKTMPLEDSSKATEDSKDMDDVESDLGSAEDGAQDKQMESSSQPTPIKADTPDESSPPSDQETEQASDSNGTPKTTDHTATTSSGSQTKLGSGFSNTSSASPFANVKPGENVFGSSSSTLQGMSATSAASPFANVGKSTNVFGGSKPSAFSGGFSNTSSVSPFASMAASTNVFGGESAKDVFGGGSAKSAFGQGSTTTASAFGSSAFGAPASPESTSGSVFGAQSVVGSVAGTNKPTSTVGSKFASNSQPATTGSFSTFGAKNTFGAKEGSFSAGSFISQEGSQEQADFGDLLSQEAQNKEDSEQPEESERSFGVGVFSGADQIDVQTGEENEMTIYQTKGKLYADAEKTKTWKERGKGTFKVNVGRRDTKVARLVMRTDGVLRLILNISIFPEMNMSISGDKYIYFMGIEEGKPISFLLKVKDAATADEVVQHINRAADRQLKGKGQGVVLRD
ncbi:hypothetical protein BGZ95_002685, partial [Linnemannia exigua]